MKAFSLFVALAVFGFSKSQNIKIDTLLTDKISIRAIEVYGAKVWYAGSQSKFGFVDIKKPSNRKQIKINELNQEFRVLARFKDASFQTVNIGSPAQFYNIDKEFNISELVKLTDSTTFYDSYKVDPKTNNGLAIGDPFSNGRVGFYMIVNGDVTDIAAQLPTYAEGEAHFAASNSNIAMQGDKVWIASGGSKARIFKFDWSRISRWEVFETPFIQGTSSQGIYSIDFYDKNHQIFED